MRPCLVAVATAALLGCATASPPGAAPAAPSTAAPSDPGATARTYVDALAAGDFAGAAARFSPKLRDALPPPALAKIWTDLTGQFGAFREVAGLRVEPAGSHQVALVAVRLERATVNLRVAVDGAGQVDGFFLAGVEPAEAPAARDAAYVRPDRFRTREVTVGVEPRLPGTLAIPEGAGPFPAVVLVHGSGPNDRDGTVLGGPNRPLRDLALGLASRGIATLRHDKRTKVHALSGAFTAKEEAIDDAAAAVRWLRTLPEIDPARIFVLGHSAGGQLAPRIARAEPSVAGLVLLAASALPIEEHLVRQTAYLANLDGTVTPEEAAALEGTRKAAAAIAALAPGDTAAPLGVPASYWLDLRASDGPAIARTLPQPLLVLQGGRDYQVIDADLARWRAALGHRTDVDFRVYPALNHLFIAGEGPSGPAEYRVPAHVAPEVIEDVAAFVLARR